VDVLDPSQVAVTMVKSGIQVLLVPLVLQWELGITLHFLCSVRRTASLDREEFPWEHALLVHIQLVELLLALTVLLADSIMLLPNRHVWLVQEDTTCHIKVSNHAIVMYAQRVDSLLLELLHALFAPLVPMEIQVPKLHVPLVQEDFTTLIKASNRVLCVLLDITVQVELRPMLYAPVEPMETQMPNRHVWPVQVGTICLIKDSHHVIVIFAQQARLPLLEQHQLLIASPALRVGSILHLGKRAQHVEQETHQLVGHQLVPCVQLDVLHWRDLFALSAVLAYMLLL
jgi:hypothetical protein